MGNQADSTFNNSRDYWDIVKAIGIICVVFGHCCTNFTKAVHYVYLFHLAVFFFVSGYLWSEEKYGDNPALSFAARMKSNWGKYVFASVIIVVLHNVFVKVGLLINQPIYTVDNMMIAVFTSLIFNCTELLASPMWFVPLLILGLSFFALIVMIARKFSKRSESCTGIKYGLVVGLSLIIGYLGVYATMRNWGFNYNIQIAMLIVPIFAVSYLSKKITKNSIEKYTKWYIALPIAIGLWLGMDKLGWRVTLSSNSIGNPWVFYAVSFAGIYVCLSVASLLLKVKPLRRITAFVGRYSFDIMAWHLVVVKLIDVIYAAIISEHDMAVYGVFTNAYASQLWWVYLLFGVGIPAVAAHGVKRLCQRCHGKA